MPFEVPLRVQVRESFLAIDGRAFHAGHDVSLRYSGSDDGMLGIDVVAGSRLWLGEEGQARRDVIFSADLPLIRLGVMEVPQTRQALRDHVHAQMTAPEVVPPMVANHAMPVISYLVNAGTGAATDLIAAIEECRGHGGSRTDELLRCLRGKSFDIGLSAVGRLLRCLPPFIGIYVSTADPH